MSNEQCALLSNRARCTGPPPEKHDTPLVSWLVGSLVYINLSGGALAQEGAIPPAVSHRFAALSKCVLDLRGDRECLPAWAVNGGEVKKQWGRTGCKLNPLNLFDGKNNPLFDARCFLLATMRKMGTPTYTIHILCVVCGFFLFRFFEQLGCSMG